MSLRDRVVQIARQEVDKGIIEVPVGFNMDPNQEIMKYWSAVQTSYPGPRKNSKGNWPAYCAAFVSWVFQEAGNPFTWSEGKGSSLARDFRSAAIAQGAWTENINGVMPQPGDIIVTRESSPQSHGSHVGVVVSVSGDRYVAAEGNYNNGVKYRTHKRDSLNVLGWASPYPKSSGSGSASPGSNIERERGASPGGSGGGIGALGILGAVLGASALVAGGYYGYKWYKGR